MVAIGSVRSWLKEMNNDSRPKIHSPKRFRGTKLKIVIGVMSKFMVCHMTTNVAGQKSKEKEQYQLNNPVLTGRDNEQQKTNCRQANCHTLVRSKCPESR